MAIGKSKIIAEDHQKKITIDITLDNKGKYGESSGLLVNVTNEIHDALRKHFCAHQLRVPVYAPVKPKPVKHDKITAVKPPAKRALHTVQKSYHL